jgi:hypothetical protein
MLSVSVGSSACTYICLYQWKMIIYIRQPKNNKVQDYPRSRINLKGISWYAIVLLAEECVLFACIIISLFTCNNNIIPVKLFKIILIYFLIIKIYVYWRIAAKIYIWYTYIYLRLLSSVNRLILFKILNDFYLFNSSTTTYYIHVWISLTSYAVVCLSKMFFSFV